MSEPLPDVLHDAIAHFSARAATQLRDAVAVGSVPEVSAFDHERDRVGLALEDVALSGLESLQPTRFDWGGGTHATLTLATDTASLRGKYRVASTPVSRPALEMAKLLDSPDALAAAATAESDTQLAAWFRDAELHNSQNGQVLSGMYYDHEDTINALTTGTSAASKSLRNAMRTQATKNTAGAVRASTAAHREAKLHGQSADNVPPVGDKGQFDGGMTVSTYLMQASIDAAGPKRDDPANEYARLLNSTKWFSCAVRYVRSKHAGPLTPQEILRIIAATPRSEIPCPPKVGMLQGAEGTDRHEDEAPQWPLDADHFLKVYAARTERVLLRKMAPAGGSFADDHVRLEIDVDVTLDGAVGIESMRPRVTMLRIRLAAGDAFTGRESLHGRLDVFAGETAFYIDLMRTRITAALSAPEIRDRFAQSLNS
jgi:hypothetical protein